MILRSPEIAINFRLVEVGLLKLVVGPEEVRIFGRRGHEKLVWPAR